MGPLTGFAMNPARDFPDQNLRLDRRMGDVDSPVGGKDIPYFLGSAVWANYRGGAGRIRLSQINWSPLTVRHLCGRGKRSLPTLNKSFAVM